MRRAGPWLRWVGMLIELIGITAVVRDPGGRVVPVLPMPGGAKASAGYLIFALGLVLWITSQVLLAIGRRREP